MTIALSMTVRDERSMLRTNLRYHHFLGVDIAYVYDDGSTDDTIGSIADLPYVVALDSVPADAFADRPELGLFTRARETNFVARQALNSIHAMEQARAAGATWLLAIDADELVAIDLTRPEKGALAGALARQRADVEAVTFPPLEVVQRRLEYDNVIAEETLFKRADRSVTRNTYDPFSGEERSVPAVYGHTAGKMAVRLSLEALPRTVHQFVHADGRPLRTATTGYLLHYYSHDFPAFAHKFRLMRDHPDRHLQGATVVFQKRLWRDVVNRSGMDEAELREYYRRWVMFDEADVERLSRPAGTWPLRRRPAIVEVTSAREALRVMDAG